MRPWLMLLTWMIAATSHAAADESAVNYCHDQAAWDKIDTLLKRFPNDQLLIRSYAMRVGICRLIDEKKISLEAGIEVFDIERQRAVMERGMEDARRQRKKPLSEDDLEPLS